ncbi:AsmA-like C-terminal region-containing protein [Ekhidna sp.]|uniref:AsmA-like C-terminal region-containing protein n=1 Tax=Ekhidna sp. TaxID=2608089 RepID=UPI003B510625
MKKVLIILGVVVVILIAAIIILPIIFKDDVRKAIDDSMAESIDANVYYDIDGFSLSLIKNFPDVTVSMSDFGIVGKGAFEQDTLVGVNNFLVTVDLMSVISGDQIIIEEIALDQPKIMVKVLPDGTANYDIAKSTEEESVEENIDTSSEGNVSIGINKWSITNASLKYLDQSLNFYTTLIGLNHEGSGDFNLDVFDMSTNTTVDAASLGFEGVEYVSNKTLDLAVILNMDLGQMKFTFKENRIAVNQFAMNIDGFVSMPGDDIEMDINFGGSDISLTSILSLIPGVYQEYLDGVDASGNIGFNGYVKGTFNETSMPAIAANLSIDDGGVKYADFNIPIENINLKSSFDYPSADLSETSFNIDNFSMLVDGESVSSYLKFKNLENYQWDFGFEGNADLEKITKVVPLEGVTLMGKINAKLKSSGMMSEIEAGRYENLPTSGNLSINDFLFRSADLPQGFEISKANLSFNPSEISLSEFSAKSGNSDFSLTGKVTNFLAFALSENGVLAGSLDFSSSLIDLDELMPEESLEEEETTDEPLEVVRIPENIDFTLASSIDKIAYSNMPITDFKGKIVIRDGAILLEKNTFSMLDGNFEMTGSYVTKDLDQPKYDLGFKIQGLSIASAFNTFETVRNYVPIAEQVTGKFSADFSTEGLLGDDMMPLMDEIYLQGLVNIAQASLEKGQFVQKLSAVTSLKPGAKSADGEADPISLKDVLIQTEIKDGRLFIEPFELNVGGQNALVGGNNTLDGQLDYSMLLKDIPTGQIGNALNSALSSLTGGKKLVSDKINLNLGIGGTYDDVAVKLLGTSDASGGKSTSATESFKQELTSKVDGEKEKAEAELVAKKEEQRQKIMSEAQTKAEQIRSQGKASAEKIRQEGYAAADKVLAEAGSNPIKKKVAEETAKKLRSEADKKANAVEAEANQKADQLISEAQDKASKI